MKRRALGSFLQFAATILLFGRLLAPTDAVASPLAAAPMLCAGPQALACIGLLGITSSVLMITAGNKPKLVLVPKSKEVNQAEFDDTNVDTDRSSKEDESKWRYLFNGVTVDIRHFIMMGRDHLTKHECDEIRSRVSEVQYLDEINKNLRTSVREVKDIVYNVETSSGSMPYMDILDGSRTFMSDSLGKSLRALDIDDVETTSNDCFYMPDQDRGTKGIVIG